MVDWWFSPFYFWSTFFHIFIYTNNCIFWLFLLFLWSFVKYYFSPCYSSRISCFLFISRCHGPSLWCLVCWRHQHHHPPLLSFPAFDNEIKFSKLLNAKYNWEFHFNPFILIWFHEKMRKFIKAKFHPPLSPFKWPKSCKLQLLHNEWHTTSH